MASLEVKGLIDLWNHQPGVFWIPTTGGAVEITWLYYTITTVINPNKLGSNMEPIEKKSIQSDNQLLFNHSLGFHVKFR